MSGTKCSIGWRWESRVRFGVFFFMATFSLAAQLPSQIGAEAGHGALEVTSGLGRKLYALPDDESVIDARKNLAADPKNVERVLQLSKAEAARRQYREAVATSTEGLAFAPKNADLYLGTGPSGTRTAGVQASHERPGAGNTARSGDAGCLLSPGAGALFLG